jgi:hypothetical protein
MQNTTLTFSMIVLFSVGCSGGFKTLNPSVESGPGNLSPAPLSYAPSTISSNSFPIPPATHSVDWNAVTNSLLDPAIFHWKFYLDWNADLRPAGITTQAKAEEHWTNTGYKECRRASAEFHSVHYLSLNPDVAAAYGANNCAGAVSHYLNYGRMEYGRQKTFPFSYGLNFGAGDATFGNQKITMRTSASYAGTVSELWFRGVQYVNDHDTGRLFQTAFQLDGYGECYNPTEGGSSFNGAGPSQSALLSLNTSNGALQAVTNPTYWYPPGYKTYCGTGQGQSLLANTLITKNITVGFEGDDQIIHWRSQINLPENHLALNFETLTGYHNGSFTNFYNFDPYTFQLTRTGAAEIGIDEDAKAHFAYPTVISTPDGSHALGVFAIDQENQTPDRQLRIPKMIRMTYLRDVKDQTTKWSAWINYPAGAPAGNYYADTFLVIGNLEEVRTRMAKLQNHFRHQIFSLLASSYGNLAYNPPTYGALNPDVAAYYGYSLEPLLPHFLFTGAFEGRSSSYQLNVRAYMNRYPDLQAAFGADNLIAALKHYIEQGINEGRYGGL